MLPLVPQLATRLSLLGLGCRCLYEGVMIGVVRCGVVIRGELEGLGGSVLGRASQNPGLGSQAKGGGEFSLRTFLRYILNLVRFAWGTVHALTWLALLLQSTKHSPRIHQRAHMKMVLSHLGQSDKHFPAKSCLQSLLSFIKKIGDGGGILDDVISSGFVGFPFLSRLVVILAGAVSYGTVTFRKKLGF